MARRCLSLVPSTTTVYTVVVIGSQSDHGIDSFSLAISCYLFHHSNARYLHIYWIPRALPCTFSIIVYEPWLQLKMNIKWLCRVICCPITCSSLVLSSIWVHVRCSGYNYSVSIKKNVYYNSSYLWFMFGFITISFV